MTKFKMRREIVWPILLAGTITVCSGYPAAAPEMGWFEPDKLGHFAAYGTLATAIYRHPGLVRRSLFGAFCAILLASAYGLGDEFRQSLTGGIRQYDLADWAADTLGAITAGVLYLRWGAYRRLLETPLMGKRLKPTADLASEEDWPQKKKHKNKISR